MLFFDVAEEVMKERCMKRAETSGRSDDNEETIVKRLTTYLNESKPLVKKYEKENLLVKIDASKSIDEVYAQAQEGMTLKIAA